MILSDDGDSDVTRPQYSPCLYSNTDDSDSDKTLPPGSYMQDMSSPSSEAEFEIDRSEPEADSDGSDIDKTQPQGSSMQDISTSPSVNVYMSEPEAGSDGSDIDKTQPQGSSMQEPAKVYMSKPGGLGFHLLTSKDTHLEGRNNFVLCQPPALLLMGTADTELSPRKMEHPIHVEKRSPNFVQHRPWRVIPIRVSILHSIHMSVFDYINKN
jgi:hypothetical protein